jgi:shikimate O-hydroxycinnamoyltransferase
MSLFRNLASRAGRKRSRLVRAGAPTGESVPLSAFDLLTGPVYTPRAFFYERTLDGAALAASLVRTLRRFPVLAGRMRRGARGGLEVVCNDAGVRFVEAESPVPMPAYGPAHPAKRDFAAFVEAVNPLWVVDRDTPLLTVKLTHMAGGGSVLGACIAHGLVDGASYMAFMESWSREHRGLPSPVPCHDRRLLDDVGRRAAPGQAGEVRHFVDVPRLEELRFYARLVRASRRLVTEVFRFSAGEVRRMKDAASADLHGTGQWISTNDAVTAHLWKCLAELRGRPDASPESLGLVAGVRDRLAPELPPHYFGNCVSHTTPTLAAGDLRGRCLGEVALSVRRGLDDNTLEKLRGEIAFLVAHRDGGLGGKILPRMMLDVEGATVTFNNMSKLPFYAADFGGGAPFWYDVPAFPIPWLTLVAPTPSEDGGRDVHVAVPAEKLAAYRSRSWQALLRRYDELNRGAPTDRSLPAR